MVVHSVSAELVRSGRQLFYEDNWPPAGAIEAFRKFLAAALGVNCLAFQEAPSADVAPRGRGRPKKAETVAGKGKRNKS